MIERGKIAEKNLDVTEKLKWASKDLLRLKLMGKDPHLEFIDVNELTDNDLQVYYDFCYGVIPGQEIEKIQHSSNHFSPMNNSSENLYAMMLNMYLSELAEKRLKKIA